MNGLRQIALCCLGVSIAPAATVLGQSPVLIHVGTAAPDGRAVVCMWSMTYKQGIDPNGLVMNWGNIVAFKGTGATPCSGETKVLPPKTIGIALTGYLNGAVCGFSDMVYNDTYWIDHMPWLENLCGPNDPELQTWKTIAYGDMWHMSDRDYLHFGLISLDLTAFGYTEPAPETIGDYTFGRVPNSAFTPTGDLDPTLVPDFVAALDKKGALVGYVRREDLLLREGGRRPRINEEAVPVFNQGVESVGLMYPGVGFVAKGELPPPAKPFHGETRPYLDR